LAGSPCIDVGTSTNAPAGDCDGVARPLDGNTNGVAHVDMGAFEFVHPLADTDRDGMLDAAEGIAGTDPTDLVSVLRTTIRFLTPSGPVMITWPSVLGRTYQLEWAATLPPAGGWQSVSNNIPGVGGALTVADTSGASSNRFYRVRTRLAP
jgi:hypothetical protein